MITKTGAARALRRRRVHQHKPIILNPNFPEQNSFVLDPSRFIDAQCSRRAGKSNGLGLRFLNTMERYPGSQSMYTAMTFDSAKEIMTPVFEELDTIHKIGLKINEGKITHPNRAVTRLMGADMKNFVKRLKGRKYPGVAIDEAQDFGSHIQSLIDDVFSPAIADYPDGWLAITGTPGPVPRGYFFDVTQNRKYGYSHHEWTLLQNPYMPDAAGFIRDLMIKREWDETHPTLLREYRNKWVLDTQSLWVIYNAAINDYLELPKAKWNYVLGIDLGFKDADALAVLAWHPLVRETYLVEEVLARKQGITELVAMIKACTQRYDISKMVIDEGGLGKKIAEEIRRQHAIPVHQADKIRKQENVAFLNDALRAGRFKAKANSQFAQDSYLVQIDWDKSTHDRIVVKKNYHSDIIDAVLYAFKECPTFAYQEPPKLPKLGTAEHRQMMNERLFREELERMQAQQIADGEKQWWEQD
jgi:hypothetical protein